MNSFEDEEDWEQVNDASVSFDSTLLSEGLSVDFNSNRQNDSHSFRITSNGSIVFNALIPSVKKTNVMDRIELMGPLGQGSCAEVFKAKEIATGEILALKKVSLANDKFRRKHVVNELLAAYEHRNDEGEVNQNIVRFIDTFSYDDEQAVGLLFEYMDRGSLESLVHKVGSIEDEAVLAYIARECLQGEIKLSDFGLAKQLVQNKDIRTSTFVGTLKYMAPERTRGEDYDQSSDIFSFGLTVLSIAHGKAKKRGYWDTLSETCFSHYAVEGETCQAWTNEFREFVSLCLEKDPSRRPSARDLLDHSFITEQAEHGKDRFISILS